jgi:hypothetical protein
MTFQPPPPPPPPPGGTPPPPPPGQPYGQQPPSQPYGQQPAQPYAQQPPAQQWGAPAPGYGAPGGPGAGFDPKTVNPLDWALVAIGVLTFIFSFTSFYTYKFSFTGFASATAKVNAWHGFFGWFGALCALAASALIAMSFFAPQVKLPVANRLGALALYALATLCLILALFVYPGSDVSGAGLDKGHGFGYWIDLILVIAGTVISLMRAQQTGTALPGALNKMPKIGN